LAALLNKRFCRASHCTPWGLCK